MNQMTKNKIKILSTIPGLYKFNKFGGKNSPLPINVTISLLYSCNSRCMTCNVYEKKVNNFTIEEYKKVFESLGEIPFWFTMSGGEPFLRKDIAEIGKAAYDICKPGIINIPTNGSLNKVVFDRVKELVEYAKSFSEEIIVSKKNAFLWTDNAQNEIIQDIKEKGLNRIVASAWTPRTHEVIYRGTIAKTDLNPYYFQTNFSVII